MTLKVHNLCTNVKFAVSFTLLCLFYLLIISFICEKVVYKNSSQVTYSMLNSQHLFIPMIVSSHNIFYLWESSLQNSSQVTYSMLNSQHLFISLILSSHIFHLWESSLQKLFTGHILHVEFTTLIHFNDCLLIISFICEEVVVYKNSSQVTYSTLNSQHLFHWFCLLIISLICDKVVYKKSSQITFTTLIHFTDSVFL
jgi:hypothetical protein